MANNGLAAVKFMRSIRSWSTQTLGSSKAVTLVAMASPNDIRINAEHIHLADQFVEVPGGSNNNNYANVSLIVQVAVRAGVDAVWPGWCVWNEPKIVSIFTLQRFRSCIQSTVLLSYHLMNKHFIDKCLPQF